jgi:hypothetical protein
MKHTALVIVIFLAAFAFGGCQNAATSTAANTTTTNTTAANTAKPAASPKAAAELPPSRLKPEDIDLDKPVPAEELRNAVFANEDGWKGKEVAVIGDYNGHSTSKLQSGDKYSVNVQNAERKIVMKCNGKVAPPSDVRENRNGRVFRGTVTSINKSFQQVTLEPCEIVK